MTSGLHVAADLDALSRAVAEAVVALAQAGVRAGGTFNVALVGGSTPRRLYTLLASAAYRRRMPWPSVHVFWTDERCVPPEHPHSNFRMASESLLSHVPIPPANVHRVPVEQGPADAAGAYERTLRDAFHLRDRAVPAFDLILLGLGRDGHTASLFPGSAALRQTERLVTTSLSDQAPHARVTLTLPVLCGAKQLFWLVAGTQKAAVLRDLLQGTSSSEDLPAGSVQVSAAAACWFVDEAAAGRLGRTTKGMRTCCSRPM